MGSIVKSGTRADLGRARAGREAAHGSKGLIYAATPASDFICGTLQLAAGMNLHVFTTGRGTPYGLAEVPVIKVATRSDLARRWHDLMDVNAGRIADGDGDDRGRRLGAVPPDARRRERPQQTWAEQLEAAQRAGAVQPGAGDLSGRLAAGRRSEGAFASVRRASLDANVDATRLGLLELGDAQGQHAIAQAGVDLPGVEVAAQLEAAPEVVGAHLGVDRRERVRLAELERRFDRQVATVDADRQVLAGDAGQVGDTA